MKGPRDRTHPWGVLVPPLPLPAFLCTWHRQPGEGKAQEVVEEEKEEEEEEEEVEEEEEEKAASKITPRPTAANF